MKHFQGSTVVITGASSGIGREFALQLAPSAANIVIAARRLDRLEALQSEIAALHPAVHVFPYGLDLADEKETTAFLAWIAQSGLEVDFLINNAGLGDHGPFLEARWERIQEMVAVNISALTKITLGLLPSMQRRRQGAILNVSSVASLIPVPFLNVYAATKAYVTSFSEGLRAELRRSNISVTVLCPGPVPTEFGRNAVRPETHNRFDMSTPDFFSVNAAAAARAGLRAVAADRARIVPGVPMFLAALFLSMLPIAIIRPFLNIGVAAHKGNRK